MALRVGLPILLLCLLTVPHRSDAQWQSCGTTLSATAYFDYSRIVSDGADGAIVVWRDRSVDGD
jgi:hypothetical protein